MHRVWMIQGKVSKSFVTCKIGKHTSYFPRVPTNQIVQSQYYSTTYTSNNPSQKFKSGNLQSLLPAFPHTKKMKKVNTSLSGTIFCRTIILINIYLPRHNQVCTSLKISDKLNSFAKGVLLVSTFLWKTYISLSHLNKLKKILKSCQLALMKSWHHGSFT